jgi:CDP-paratose 2-epimerase
MRILITGGAGFVGSALARHLKQTVPGASIIAFDNLRRRGAELNLISFRELGIEFVHGDIRNRSDLAALDGDFDVLIDASAEPSVHAAKQQIYSAFDVPGLFHSAAPGHPFD